MIVLKYFQNISAGSAFFFTMVVTIIQRFSLKNIENSREVLVIFFKLVHVGDRHGAHLGLSIKVTSMLQKMTSSFYN